MCVLIVNVFLSNCPIPPLFLTPFVNLQAAEKMLY